LLPEYAPPVGIHAAACGKVNDFSHQIRAAVGWAKYTFLVISSNMLSYSASAACRGLKDVLPAATVDEKTNSTKVRSVF